MNTWVRNSGGAPLIALGGGGGDPANPIVDARRTDWSYAGANIATGRTKHGSTIAAYSGTSSTITTALAAAAAGTYVELGAGTFNLTTGIRHQYNNVTLRGQGMSTILNFSEGAQDTTGWTWPEGCPLTIAPSSAYNSDTIPTLTGAPAAAVNINGTHGNASQYPKGATILNMASSPAWAIGDSLAIVANNVSDASLPAAGFFLSTKTVNHPATNGIAWQGEYWNYGAALMFRCVITNVSGSNITIYPPLPHALFTAGATARAFRYAQANWVTGAGIENLRVNTSSFTSSIDCVVGMHRCSESWIKGVGVVPKYGTFHGGDSCNFCIGVKDSYRNSIVNNWVDPNLGGMATGTTTTYAVSTLGSSHILVENNIFKNPESPLVPHVSCVGCVYAYNYEQYVGDNSQETGVIFHSIGSVYNLIEGNRVMKLSADLFHGNTMLNTVYRNHFQDRGTDLQSYHRFWNMVGNVVDATTVRKTLATDSTKYDRWARFGFRLGYNGQSDTIDPNFNGSTSLDGVAHDPDTWLTAMLWGNYTTTGGSVFNSAEVPSSDATFPNTVPGSNDLPASQFRTSRPGYFTISGFGTQQWPLIGPDVSGGDYLAGHAYKTPAQIVYEAAGGLIANFDPSVYG